MLNPNNPVSYDPNNAEQLKAVNALMKQSFLQAEKDGLLTKEYVWELTGHPDIDRVHLISCKSEHLAKEFANRGLKPGLSIGKLISSRVMKLEDFDA